MSKKFENNIKNNKARKFCQKVKELAKEYEGLSIIGSNE